MKTTKELIKKHDNVFFIILIMIVISGIALIGEIMYKTDEIWNFQNVNNSTIFLYWKISIWSIRSKFPYI